MTGERGGAMLLALAVVAVVGVLGAVLLANAQGSTRRAERVVDRAEAGSLTDVAVAEGWAQVAGGAAAAFTLTGTEPTGPWRVDARPEGRDRWTLVATGGDGPDATVTTVVMTRQPLHPYTLFVRDLSAGPLRGRVVGRVGITGAAVFAGRSVGSVQELIGPDATCAGCRNPVVVERAAARTIEAGGSSPDPCPDLAGEITGTLTGTYRCSGPATLTFAGTVDVSGPVVIELGPDVSVDFSDAMVNPAGDPSDLVIVQRDAGAASLGADGATLRALLYAPTTPFPVGSLTWTGSVDVGSFTPDPGARLDGTWDASLERLGLGDWLAESWDVEPA